MIPKQTYFKKFFSPKQKRRTRKQTENSNKFFVFNFINGKTCINIEDVQHTTM